MSFRTTVLSFSRRRPSREIQLMLTRTLTLIQTTINSKRRNPRLLAFKSYTLTTFLSYYYGNNSIHCRSHSFNGMYTTNGIDCCWKLHRLSQMATTVVGNCIDCYKWQQLLLEIASTVTNSISRLWKETSHAFLAISISYPKRVHDMIRNY